MKFTQSLKMAVSSLASNKGRSFLTMLGIIIGVFSVTILITIVDGATGQMTGSLESMGSNMVMVSVNSPKPPYIKTDDLQTLVVDDDILQIGASTSGNGNLTAGVESTSGSVTGVTGNYADMQGLALDNGRFLTDMDVETRSNNVVIDYDTSVELFGTNRAVGSTLMINGSEFNVVGVLEASDTAGIMSGTTVLIPVSTAQRLFSNTEFDMLYVQASAPETVENVVALLDAYMLEHLGDEDYFSITNNEAVLDMMDEMIGIMVAVLAGIAGISLLVGGIGIMNIMLVSVTERTREIGVRKAIGAKRFDILSQFVTEAVLLCVLGGLLGLLLGYGGSLAAGALMDMEFSVSASTISLALGFSLFVGLVFGIYPANKAARLRPIQALRYE